MVSVLSAILFGEAFETNPLCHKLLSFRISSFGRCDLFLESHSGVSSSRAVSVMELILVSVNLSFLFIRFLLVVI